MAIQVNQVWIQGSVVQDQDLDQDSDAQDQDQGWVFAMTFLPGQWKKTVKTVAKTFKTRQKLKQHKLLAVFGTHILPNVFDPYYSYNANLHANSHILQDICWLVICINRVTKRLLDG